MKPMTKIPTVNTTDLKQETLAEILTEHGQFVYVMNHNAYVIAIKNVHTPTKLDYNILDVSKLQEPITPGGLATTIITDDTSTTIDMELYGNEDVTYLLPQAISVNIELVDWQHGNYGGLTFKKATPDLDITITTKFNDMTKSMPLLLMKQGQIVDKLKPDTLLDESLVQMAFHCDGIYIYCYYVEVDTHEQGV